MKFPQQGGSKKKNVNKPTNNIKKVDRETVRKNRKEEKKQKAFGAYKGLKKGNAPPNLNSFKKKIVESIERKKQTQHNKELAEKLKSKGDGPNLDEDSLIQSMNKSMYYEEESRINLFGDLEEQEEEKFDYQNPNLVRQQNAKFKKELIQVVEASDIILEVLDARDPLGCRCQELERKIMGMPGSKKLILVLNKIDLVPTNILDKWRNYLRREFACILFKANTQGQRSNLSSNNFFMNSLGNKEDLINELLHSSKALGPENLLQLIKNYSKTDGVKQAVTVGLIGYPNVGKSSVINSLKKTRAVGVSSLPGYTKNLQEVQLDQKVKLLDCPGVIFSDDDEANLVLKNIIKVSDIKDPIGPIDGILERANRDRLMLKYEIQEFNNSTEFLTLIAMRRGKFIKGGIANLEDAAKIVLNDWVSGEIQYFTMPPDENIGGIVGEM